MQLRSPLRVPAWVPRVPSGAAVAWGLAYAAFAVWKILAAKRSLCGPTALEGLSDCMAFAETLFGVLVAVPPTRHRAALCAFAMNVGLVLFAVVAHVRGLAWEGCNCVPALNLPWLPWHALIAAALAVPFLWMFVDAERRA
jgi:hypothetical protein